MISQRFLIALYLSLCATICATQSLDEKEWFGGLRRRTRGRGRYIFSDEIKAAKGAKGGGDKAPKGTKSSKAPKGTKGTKSSKAPKARLRKANKDS